MKKLLSLILALVLCLSLGATAFAAETVYTGTSGKPITPVTNGDIKFQVVYKDKEGHDLGDGAYPKGDELTFTVNAVSGNPDKGNAKITVNPHTVNANPAYVAVTLPSYSTPGKYNYTIQQSGSAQGVTYDETLIGVQVLVTNKKGGKGFDTTVTFNTKKEDNVKIDNLVNIYTVNDETTSPLSVKKVVAGDLADKTQKFDVDVTLTKTGAIYTDISVGGTTYAPAKWDNNTLKITLTLEPTAENPTVIKGIPNGVTYVVKEQAKHLTETANDNLPDAGYTDSYTVDTHAGNEGTIGDETPDVVVVTNTKGSTGETSKPQTGVYMDFIPYVIILTVAIAGLILFVVKRRKENED